MTIWFLLAWRGAIVSRSCKNAPRGVPHLTVKSSEGEEHLREQNDGIKK